MKDEKDNQNLNGLEHTPSLKMNPGDQAPPGSEQTGDALCFGCGGSGEINGKPCQTCNGTGKIIQIIGEA